MRDTHPLTSAQDIAQMMDISAVRADSSDKKVEEVVRRAIFHGCYLVTILPSQTLLAKKLIAGLEMPKLGGNVGFPSGGQTTKIKVAETRELVGMGVDEIDMVIDIAAHLSGRYDDVLNEMRSVVAAAEGRPVKTILECHYLNIDQIKQACDLAIQAGAAFVKTGTGWAPTGATVENIDLIKKHVGSAIQIKASGGIRNVEMLIEMYRRGATRFGISLNSAAKILDSAANLRYSV